MRSLLPPLALLLVPLVAEARTVTVNGTLVNRTIAGSFTLPENAPFTLTFEVDDASPDRDPADQFAGEYRNAISTVTFSVPSASFSISGTAEVGHWLYVYREYYSGNPLSLVNPSVRTTFDLENTGTAESYHLNIEFYAPPPSRLASDAIPADFSTSTFRLASVRLSEKKTTSGGLTYEDPIALGWDRAGGVSPGAKPPAVRKSGYALPVVFGDSLSQAGDAETSSDTYFAGGETNGPVWIEYLSWLLGMDYDNRLNFSEFGGIRLPETSTLEGYPFEDALGVFWSQSAVFNGIFAVLLSDGDAGLLASQRKNIQEEILLRAEAAYTLGLRDYLMLNTADITIAPLVKELVPDADGRALVRNQVFEYAPDLQYYVDEWFGGLFPGMRVSVVDPNDYLDELLGDPAAFGLTNVVDAHVESGPTPLADHFGNPGSTYFFWSDRAITTKVHANLAGRIYSDVFASGPPGPFRAQVARLTPGEVWLFAADPPTGVTIDLRTGDGLDFGNPPARSFTTTDPCLFLIEPRAPGGRAFFRLESP